MSAFSEGWVRGTFAGAIALLAGLLVAEITRFAGLPSWITAGLGVWTFLAAMGIMAP